MAGTVFSHAWLELMQTVRTEHGMASTCSPDLFKDAEQHVGVEGALMGFVHDDSTVVIKVALTQCLTQENTICHVLVDGLLGRDVLEANGIAHLQQKAACSDSAMLPAHVKVQCVGGQQQPPWLRSLSDMTAQPSGGASNVLRLQMVSEKADAASAGKLAGLSSSHL